MGDPAGAAAHVTIAKAGRRVDGRQPMAGDRLEDNLNPGGRL